MTLKSPVEDIKGVGPEIAKKLRVLGIETVFDLIDYLPRRYDDYSQLQTISRIQPGPVSLRVTIKQAKGRYVRRGLHITEAVASDESGSIKLVWFNQPYRAAALKPKKEYFISGDFGLHGQQLSIQNPSVELASEFPVNTARILPIYRETKGLTSKQIRSYVARVKYSFSKLEESLPGWILNKYKLVSRSSAYYALHFPENADQLRKARARLGFEEVFQLSLASLLIKQQNEQAEALSVPFNQKLAQSFVEHLDFTLTDAQRKAVWVIYQSIQDKKPMNRLLEGDVGAGKTVVAAMSALMAMKQGFQVLFMAPTGLLARQHADTLYDLLKPLGMEQNVHLLVGSMTKKQKQSLKSAAKTHDGMLLVGTHALLESDVMPQNVALVIVDEQHRFGVEQRKTLLKKSKKVPHVLSMTATPIPRSLALTLYGELEVTILNEKPGNRKPIKTHLVNPTDREKIYKHVIDEVESGRQAFIVCPLVEQSSQLKAASAEETYEKLKKTAFKTLHVGLLHGKMNAHDKDVVMQRFAHKEIDVLVATTVIEVGVDVPNATVMLIENPERFGLAQLHQLRGRVGRSHHQGHCYLMLADSKKPSKRLRAIAQSQDGFRLAELDLEIRGPGAIYGTMQHGALDLRIAKLSDVQLIKSARDTAKEFIEKKEDLLEYPALHSAINELQKVTQLN